MSATTEATRVVHNVPQPGPLALLREGIRDLVSRRLLIRYLIVADMKKEGVNTLLGNIWWVMDPLLLMLVYLILVAVLGRGRAIPDFPLFIFSALLPFKWFRSAVKESTKSVIGEYRLIRQISFPKLILPVASVSSGVIGLAFGLIPLMAMIVFLYPERLSFLILLYPLVVAVQFVFTLAVAILLAAGNVFFRDLGNLIRYIVRLWWFLSPGLYTLEHFKQLGFVRSHPILGQIAAVNPFAILFDAYHKLAWGTEQAGPTMPDWSSLGVLLLVSVTLLAGAIVVFKRLEPNFAKVL